MSAAAVSTALDIITVGVQLLRIANAAQSTNTPIDETEWEILMAQHRAMLDRLDASILGRQQREAEPG